jgi:hypothetical protein
MRRCTTILLMSFLLALASNALAEPAEAMGSRPPLGSRARQLMLKFKLLRDSPNTPLASSLDHNRRQWELLSPDERDQFRRTAVAFLRKRPAEQEKLLERYSRLIQMSAEQRQAYQQRSRWLQAVVATLSERQRAELNKLPLEQRARRIIELRDRLVREGKLVLAPTTRPTTAPAGN